MALAELIAVTFRGRPDFVAFGTDHGFTPHPCPAGIDPEWIAERHLGHQQPLGFYVLTEDSKCWCSCVDFDNKPEHPDPEWRTRAEQVYFALIDLQLQPLVELSQSGEGTHVWLFFDEPTDAWIPRAFWKALAGRLQVTFREVFPKQDRLSGKGLGNLVRFPLWNASRFVDVENEWAEIPAEQALSEVRRIRGEDLRLVAWEAGLGNLQPSSSGLAVTGEDGISQRVRKLVDRSWTLLGRRWLNDGRGMTDSSPSAIAMSVACELVRNFVPTPEVEAALTAWCKTHAPDKAVRPDWISHTVAKAYDFIGEKTESASPSLSTIRDCALEYVRVLESGGVRYVQSGIEQLDRSIDGVSPGEMCVVAARPGQGKTAFALQWLDHASLTMPCLMISNEMSAFTLGQRKLATITRVPFEQWDAECVGHFRSEIDAYHLHRKPVYVAESCVSIQRVEEMIDQVCQIYGVGLVAVDYLQLCRDPEQERRYDEVSEISRRVKESAIRNHVPILALCQLNRESEKRADREPQLSDLRDSGQIEQDADVILFLQWPCKFDKKAQPWDYRIIAAKRRNGPIRESRILTTFNPEKQLIGVTD